MTRLDRTTAAGLWVAQQARKEARAADHAYLTTPAERWQTGGNVAFDVPVRQPDQRAKADGARNGVALPYRMHDGAGDADEASSPSITSGGVPRGHGACAENVAVRLPDKGCAAANVAATMGIPVGQSGPLTPPITSGGVESPRAILPADTGSKVRLAVSEARPSGVAPGPLTHTDAIATEDCRATVSTIQRPNPADCRTDRPSPAVPSVAAVGAPRNATGADAPTSNGGAASLGLAASAAGAPLYALVHYCRAAGLPEPVPEYRFHPTRMWRFDYAFPLHKIAVEVDGGVWTQGRHTRGAGYIADMEKMNAAAKLGWRVLKYTPQTLGVAIDDLRVVLV